MPCIISPLHVRQQGCLVRTWVKPGPSRHHVNGAEGGNVVANRRRASGLGRMPPSPIFLFPVCPEEHVL